MYKFGLFQFDLNHEQLWQDDQEIRLTQKALTLLKYFLEHSGRVVTKAELFEAVWPEAVVSDAALYKRIQELRRALQENPRSPVYLETMHRRGFRFIHTVERLNAASVTPPTSKPPVAFRDAPLCVGRETELGFLQNRLELALGGARQLVWVTGEPGIGKTTLIHTFVDCIQAREDVWVSQGQCIEQYGSGEPYLPVLDALSRLCREAQGEALIDLLYHHAPTWLVQMPSLISPTQRDALRQQTSGATQHRMLREMVETLDMLTRLKPIVLVLEDLHWSDPSTLILLAALARRREAARLLVLATYRPLEHLNWDHPLRGITHELSLHGYSHQLALEGLSESAVDAYLAERFRGASTASDLALFMRQRTEGNPLFIVHMVDYLVQQGCIRQTEGEWRLWASNAPRAAGMPETLRQLIEYQLGQAHPDAQTLLEVASVAGIIFASASVAAGLGISIETVEEQCNVLMRRTPFLRAAPPETWPDGTLTSRYAFVHALYGEALYERLSVVRRVRLHQLIGQREEQGYGRQSAVIAAALAVHFEKGRDYRRAVQYHLWAVQNALQRSGCQAAITHANTAIALLDELRAAPESDQYELQAQAGLGFALTQLKGYAAPEVGHAYNRAWALCQQVDNTFHHIPVLLGLHTFYGVRSELTKAHTLAEHCLDLARHQALPGPLAQAYNAHALSLFVFGSFKSAQASFEQAITLGDDTPPSDMLPEAPDASLQGRTFLAMTLWFLGAPEQARACLLQNIERARALANPFGLTMSLMLAAFVHQYRQEWHDVQTYTQEAMTLATDHGFRYWMAIGAIQQGWAITKQQCIEAGIAQMHDGIERARQAGAIGHQSYAIGLLAEAYGSMGQAEAGLRQLNDAFTHVRDTGEGFYEAELYRLKGELLLMRHPSQLSSAEVCFQQGLELSRIQRATSLELRVATSLGRLWHRQGKAKAAYALLAPIYNRFTEGLNTADLREAQSLLEALHVSAGLGYWHRDG